MDITGTVTQAIHSHVHWTDLETEFTGFRDTATQDIHRHITAALGTAKPDIGRNRCGDNQQQQAAQARSQQQLVLHWIAPLT